MRLPGTLGGGSGLRTLGIRSRKGDSVLANGPVTEPTREGPEAVSMCEIWAEHGIGVAPTMRDRLARQLDVNVKAMAAAKARGIKLLLGTDSGNAAVMTPGKWHGYEAAFFVKHLGYTPIEAIALQTRENALAMGLQGKLGTIEPGMIADIVILDADPSENIAVLGDPAHVRRACPSPTAARRSSRRSPGP
jgi:predicted amidohydrolase YtcJ